MKRTVHLGTKDLDGWAGGPLVKCQHWAVKVGDKWMEVAGTSKEEMGSPNEIESGYGTTSPVGVHKNGYNEKEAVLNVGKGNILKIFKLLPVPFLRFSDEILVGSTLKGDEEILDYCNEWKKKNPTYDFLRDNCQKFAYELIMWLTDGGATVPMPESALMANGQGPAAMAVSGDGESKARATCGQGTAQYKYLGLKGELPNAGAGAQFNSSGVGAYANAELFKAEANLGVGQVYLSPNLNTGIGKLEDGKVGVSVLGFGLSVGKNPLNWRISTPLGGINTGH